MVTWTGYHWIPKKQIEAELASKCFSPFMMYGCHNADDSCHFWYLVILASSYGRSPLSPSSRGYIQFEDGFTTLLRSRLLHTCPPWNSGPQSDQSKNKHQELVAVDESSGSQLEKKCLCSDISHQQWLDIRGVLGGDTTWLIGDYCSSKDGHPLINLLTACHGSNVYNHIQPVFHGKTLWVFWWLTCVPTTFSHEKFKDHFCLVDRSTLREAFIELFNFNLDILWLGHETHLSAGRGKWRDTDYKKQHALKLDMI